MGTLTNLVIIIVREIIYLNKGIFFNIKCLWLLLILPLPKYDTYPGTSCNNIVHGNRKPLVVDMMNLDIGKTP